MNVNICLLILNQRFRGKPRYRNSIRNLLLTYKENISLNIIIVTNIAVNYRRRINYWYLCEKLNFTNIRRLRFIEFLIVIAPLEIKHREGNRFFQVHCYLFSFIEKKKKERKEKESCRKEMIEQSGER